MIMMLSMKVTVNSAHVQIDALNDINFLQTGTITTEKNKFLISSDISTSEFFNENTIRVSE